jgi:LPXTG-motif cell wall-anchored protein
VEPGATIGGSQNNNLWNTADLSWTSDSTDGPDEPSTTTTTVYALGLEKTDADTGEYLAGAEFELYRDEACTVPVYVIPTNNTGVYILDDIDTIVSGYNRTTSREMYESYWETYINESKDSKTVTYVTDKNETVTTKMRRDMTTPANGQLVILGLEAGTYYLKETDAPTGYNVLSAAQEVTVGPGGVAGTYIDPSYKDKDGKPIQFAVSKIDIVNSKGVELPSTGGEGAMKMITIGSLVAMAFAVLLITHKKMSTYHD